MKITELKKRRLGGLGCPSDTRNPDNWNWDNWDNWPEEDKRDYPLKKMREKLFIDQWHDTVEVLPDSDNVWFIADGKLCVGVYEPEQQIFCMADGMGVELKNVRQWKYVGIDKQLLKYPKEKQIVAAEIKGFPCLVTGIFSSHCIDECTGDEVKALILDEDYNVCCEDNVIDWKNVFAWYVLPEEPVVIKEPVGDSVVAVLPEQGEEVVDIKSPDKETEEVISAIVSSKKVEESMDKIKESREDNKVRDWYMKEYPSDELGKEINPDLTFYGMFDCLDNYQNVYDCLGVKDSLVRERVFGELADIMNVDYDYIYDQWLKCDESKKSNEKKLQESKLRYLCIVGKREGYGPDQCGRTMTVGDMIDYLSEFDSDLPIYLNNDRGYTYGSVSKRSVYEDTYNDDPNDDDDDMDESKKSNDNKLNERSMAEISKAYDDAPFINDDMTIPDDKDVIDEVKSLLTDSKDLLTSGEKANIDLAVGKLDLINQYLDKWAGKYEDRVFESKKSDNKLEEAKQPLKEGDNVRYKGKKYKVSELLENNQVKIVNESKEELVVEAKDVKAYLHARMNEAIGDSIIYPEPTNVEPVVDEPIDNYDSYLPESISQQMKEYLELIK